MTYKWFNIESLTLIIDNNYTQVPTIILKGKWLEEAGFKSVDYVEAEIDGEKIALSKTTSPETASWKSLEEKIKDS